MKSCRSFPSRSSLEACLFVQHYVRCSSLGATHGTFLSASFQDQVETQRTSDSNLFFSSRCSYRDFCTQIMHLYSFSCIRYCLLAKTLCQKAQKANCKSCMNICRISIPKPLTTSLGWEQSCHFVHSSVSLHWLVVF